MMLTLMRGGAPNNEVLLATTVEDYRRISVKYGIELQGAASSASSSATGGGVGACSSSARGGSSSSAGIGDSKPSFGGGSAAFGAVSTW